MPRRVAAIVAHDETVPEALLTAHIPEDAGVEVVAMVDPRTLDVETVRSADADLLMVACGEEWDNGLTLVDWWHGVRPGRPVLLLTQTADHELVQRAFAEGVDDVVMLGGGPYVPEESRRELAFAVRKAVARALSRAERGPEAGTLIGVLGPKGGTGKTVVATNLAVALARSGPRTALVDLDLQFGDAALALGLDPEMTSFDLAVSGGSLDAEKLDDFMLRHSSGLRVLAAPVRPDQAGPVEPEIIARVFELLRDAYDLVVVDTQPSFGPEVIATIDAASTVYVVGMLDALSLKNTRLGLETLDLMAYPSSNVKVVLNRATSHVGLSHQDAAKILGRAPDILVPNNLAVPRSLGDGVPVVIGQPRSDVARVLMAMAEPFTTDSRSTSETAPEPRRKRRRGWHRRRRVTVSTASAAQRKL